MVKYKYLLKYFKCYNVYNYSLDKKEELLIMLLYGRDRREVK
jgi:hypothetical protein